MGLSLLFPLMANGWRKSSWMVMVAVTAIASLLAISEYSFRQSQSAQAQEVKFAQLRSTLDRLHIAVLEAQSGQRDFLLMGKDDYLARYISLSKEVEKRLEAAGAALNGDRRHNDLFAILNPAVLKEMAELDSVLQLKKAGTGWKDALDREVRYLQRVQLTDIFEHLVSLASAGTTAGQHELRRSIALGRWGVIASSIVTLVLLILLKRGKARPLKLGPDEAVQLAREQDQLETAVHERTVKLSELAVYLQDARESERQHLARELHDEMGALLTTAKLDVSRILAKNTAMSEELQLRFDHLVETLNSGIALKRRIIEDLWPSSLTHLGLKLALENHVNDLSARCGFELHLTFNAREMSDHANLTVFRIVQESLTNIIKHAKARTVDVVVRENGSSVEIVVKDDGVGFDQRIHKPTVHGLAGMAHRVEVLGGHLRIISTPGTGTELCATFPLDPR